MKFLPLILTLAILGWVVYRRVRQNIGPQRLRPARMIVNMAIMCVTGAAALHVAPEGALLYAVGGAMVGLGLAAFALHQTRFEQKPEGIFFTGNVYISLGLTALLIGRIGYRAIDAMGTPPAAPPSSASAAFADAFAKAFASPSTAGVFFAAIGYYMAFYAGLFVRARKTAMTDEEADLTRP